MALSTWYLGMFPDQSESDAVVVEIVTKGIHPIVASQAVGTKIKDVGLYKDCIDLGVTGCADGLVERWGIGLSVTILAAVR